MAFWAWIRADLRVPVGAVLLDGLRLVVVLVLLVSDFLILGWVGQKPVTDIYIFVGQVATTYYFLFFVILLPLVGLLETKLVHYRTN